jgi:uncharacterized membrane protein
VYVCVCMCVCACVDPTCLLTLPRSRKDVISTVSWACGVTGLTRMVPLLSAMMILAELFAGLVVALALRCEKKTKRGESH